MVTDQERRQLIRLFQANQDRAIIKGLGGHDTIDASGLGKEVTLAGIIVPRKDQIVAILEGGEGNDRLIGSPFNDILNGGNGDDTYTGSDGLDTFFDTGGIDTLIENIDLDILITDNTFITGDMRGDGLVQILNFRDGFDREEDRKHWNLHSQLWQRGDHSSRLQRDDHGHSGRP